MFGGHSKYAINGAQQVDLLLYQAQSSDTASSFESHLFIFTCVFVYIYIHMHILYTHTLWSLGNVTALCDLDPRRHAIVAAPEMGGLMEWKSVVSLSWQHSTWMLRGRSK